MDLIIPLKFTPEEILEIKKYVWMCPPYFAPGYNYLNNERFQTFDQTLWIFDEVSPLGYVNGRFYSLINGTYQFGYISGSVSLINGSSFFQFNNATTGAVGSGAGEYFYPEKSCHNQRPYFSQQTTTDANITSVNNKYVFTGFNHNAGAIAILPGEHFYEQLPFSTVEPNVRISVPKFIELCTQNS